MVTAPPQPSPTLPDAGVLPSTRCSTARRIRAGVLLTILCSIIGGYLYVTNSTRVRAQARDYLSKLLSAQVDVGDARLSLFEGLRLDQVVVRIPGPDGPDSNILQASTLFIRYDVRALLSGRLVALQIIVLEPHVCLSQDTQTHKWNFQRLEEAAARCNPPMISPWNRSPASHPKPGEEPPVLPQILLRDAQVDYLELKGGLAQSAGSVDIDGVISPVVLADANVTDVGTAPAAGDLPNALQFSFQSRGRLAAGPSVEGTFDVGTGRVRARLRHLVYGSDVSAMLKQEVRQWCDAHELKGRLDLAVDYTPAEGKTPVKFDVRTRLDGGQLVLDASPWAYRTSDNLNDFIWRWRQAALGRTEQPFGQFLFQACDPRPPTLSLQDVHGTIHFDNNGISTDGLRVSLDSIPLAVSGHFDGYRPESPFDWTIASPAGLEVSLPPDPPFLMSLPVPVREVYQRVNPAGRCALVVQLRRAVAGQPPDYHAEVNIHDGTFKYCDFPYPLHATGGRVTIDGVPEHHVELAELHGITCTGVAGGANAGSHLRIGGWLGPFNERIGGEIAVDARQVHNEPAVVAAMPCDAQLALAQLDPSHRNVFPTFTVNFRALARRVPNASAAIPWDVTTVIDLLDGSGSLNQFPYPLDHATGRMVAGNGVLELSGFTGHHGPAQVSVDGLIRWEPTPDDEPPPTDGRDRGPWPDLHLTASLPINQALLDALTPIQQQQLQSLGLSGQLDVNGHIFRLASPLLNDVKRSLNPDYDLNVALRDGAAWPGSGTFAITNLAGKFHLTPRRLEMIDLTARHGPAELAAHGLLDLAHPDPSGVPGISLIAHAKNLPLDAGLYHLLPPDAQAQWDLVRPSGSVDVEADYDTRSPHTTEPGIEVYSVAPPVAPGSGLALTLIPAELSVRPRAFNYQLDHVKGQIHLFPDHVILQQVTAQHGAATFATSATGQLTTAVRQWDATLDAQHLPIDHDLLAALPASWSQSMSAVHLTGSVGLHLARVSLHGNEARFTGTISPAEVSLDPGAPLSGITGKISLTGALQQGRLTELAGSVALDHMQIVGRTLQDVTALIMRPRDGQEIQMNQLQATLANGQLAGGMAMSLGGGADDATSPRYAMNLWVRDADVQEVAPVNGQEVDGKISASLNLSGSWNDAASRRGRGDVVVRGTNMYRIPLMLGLMQITNLSLPINSPFEEATAQYSVEGQNVTLEQIQLKGKDMTMEGGGHLNFDTKKVALSFVTDNPNWPTVPMVGPMWNTARQELLRIHVKGTLQSPSVSASTMDTLTTTIDDVFNGTPKQ